MRKCCMMGSRDKTSAWYILIMPALTWGVAGDARPEGGRVGDAAAPAQVPMTSGRQRRSLTWDG